MLLTNGRVVTPSGTLEAGWIRVTGSHIDQIGSGPAPSLEGEGEAILDLDGAWVGPGFIDMHVHGGGGFEVMEAGAEQIIGLAGFLARHGVTSFLPTTFTASTEDTLRVLRVIAEHRGPVAGGASVLGAHMEGPYLSQARRGAHRQEFLQGAQWCAPEQFLSTGAVRVMTVAPEAPGNGDLVRSLRERGVLVALGHSDASYAQITRAVRAGATVVTHVFNGMRGLHHREPGAAGAALDLSELTCELIADGVHLDPAVVRLVHRSKGIGGLVLVSDAGKAAGLPEGTYRRAGRTMIARDGALRLPDGTIGASVTTIDAGFRTFCAATGLQFDAAWPAVSGNAAALLGIGDRTGTLEPGKDADLTVVDAAGQVLMTLARGAVVHRSSIVHRLT